MRVLVAGASGQLGQALAALDGSAPGLSVVVRGRPGLDLTDAKSIASAVAGTAPDVVVNAGAWTAVDAAEAKEAEAVAVNATGAGALAEAAARAGAPIVHVSTDYVFDGRKNEPYREDDPTGPQGVYGRTKLAGERAVSAANPAHAILRTAWLYSAAGANFVKTMLRLAGTREEIRVVDDQHGNPTYVPDLAEGVLNVARRLVETPGDPSLRGVFHLAAPESTTWCGFAREIMAGAATRGAKTARIVPITTSEFPTPAVRPANSRLATAKIAAAYGVTLPARAESLARCLDLLLPTVV